MPFDVGFQLDFINLALVILRKRWQRIPVDYFWFEVLILNRTVPLLPDSACYQVPRRLPGEGWSVVYVGGAAQREWERAPAPPARFPSKCRIVRENDFTGACLIHPFCPRIDPLSILYLREPCLRDLSGYQCSKHCDICCQSSPECLFNIRKVFLIFIYSWCNSCHFLSVLSTMGM